MLTQKSSSQTPSQQKLDVETLEWVIGKMRALAHDFRTKSLAVTERSISESMMTVAGTLHSFASALRKTVEEQDALEARGREETLQEGGQPSPEETVV